MVTIPYYDYYCEECGQFEHKKGMNDPDLTECPECKSKVMRLYNTGGVSWKCSGSYSKVGN